MYRGLWAVSMPWQRRRFYNAARFRQHCRHRIFELLRLRRGWRRKDLFPRAVVARRWMRFAFQNHVSCCPASLRIGFAYYPFLQTVSKRNVPPMPRLRQCHLLDLISVEDRDQILIDGSLRGVVKNNIVVMEPGGE